MNSHSRNYDNVPPIPNNTVTISTTTPQVRIASTGQMRPMAVPMRPQPVPIRKVVHDGGPSTSYTTALHQQQIKEEEPTTMLDYQTASTSSGPLVAPGGSNNNSFQQYQRGTSSGISGIANAAPVMAMDQPAPVNLASKVAEVFLTAGHAFQKLGDLTLQLHTTTDADESKWSEKEVDTLKNALTRFAHELDQISSCVANRTTKHIKNDIKRRHLITDDVGAGGGANPQVKRIAMTSSGGASGAAIGAGPSYTTFNTTTGLIGAGHAVPLAQKRVGIQPISKMMTTRTMVPTRYTVAPLSSTVVVSSASGMPQLQSQNAAAPPAPAPAAPAAPPRVMTSQILPRVMTPMMKQRGMTPTSSSSGALIMEHNND